MTELIEIRQQGDLTEIWGPTATAVSDVLGAISAHRATDGALVIQIDTLDDTGRLRVNVNDGAVFDANPELGDHHDDTVSTYAEELLEKVLKPRSWDNANPLH